MTDDGYEALPESHKQQIADGRLNSLRRAGIGEAYLHMGLADVPSGQAVAGWLNTTGVAAIRAGKVIVAETWKPYGLKALTLMARTLHLHGIGIRILDSARVARMIEMREYDDFDALIEPRALFLTRFFEDASEPVERPFSGYVGRQIESLLLDRLAAGKPNFLHVTRPPSAERDVNIAAWWSNDFALAVHESVEILRIDQ